MNRILEYTLKNLYQNSRAILLAYKQLKNRRNIEYTDKFWVKIDPLFRLQSSST